MIIDANKRLDTDGLKTAPAGQARRWASQRKGKNLMNDDLFYELERLTANAALRREDLLLSGLRKSRRRKALNIAAGILALLSAGAITTVIADIFGNKGLQLAAAIVAGVSGAISLVITAYFSDDEILSMLNGSSKYLALRESVYRLVINPRITDEECFDVLSELQAEYSKLDETFSRYFSLNSGRSSKRPPPVGRWRDLSRAHNAMDNDVEELHRKMRQEEPKE